MDAFSESLTEELRWCISALLRVPLKMSQTFMNHKCTLHPPPSHKNFLFLCPVLFSLALNPSIYKNSKCYSSKGIFLMLCPKPNFPHLPQRRSKLQNKIFLFSPKTEASPEECCSPQIFQMREPDTVRFPQLVCPSAYQPSPQGTQGEEAHPLASGKTTNTIFKIFM